jgi:hypothetical protein
MPNDEVQRATDFVKEQYAAGALDHRAFEHAVAELLAANSTAEIAAVVQSVPPPVEFSSPDRRLTRPLEFNSTFGRVRLTGHWQLGAETHVSVGMGSVLVDLTQACFDDRVTDLHVTTGCGRITIIVPLGVAVQIVEHRGGVRGQLEEPVPGLPLVRLDVKTNIGTVRIQHPKTAVSGRRRRARRRGSSGSS